MKLTVVGSSSKGNCYILHNPGECLILEAGCAISDILKAIDYKTSKVAACLVSHEHGDHSQSVKKLQEYGIKCYMTKGTYCGVKKKFYDMVELVAPLEQFQIGRFSIMPFETVHDSNEPCGYLIQHPEIGTMLFAIDTCYLKYTFSGLTAIMIECNYCNELLEENVANGVVHHVVKKHIVKSHMSLDNCIKTLQANNLDNVNKIILLHLSKDNSDAKVFQEKVTEATGKEVVIAESGLTIDLI